MIHPLARRENLHGYLSPILRKLGISRLIWQRLKHDENISLWHRYYFEGKREKLKKCYKANLEIVLSEISDLIRELEGNIVITADHGEAFGEEGRWGHGYHLTTPVLRIVPWLTIQR